MFQSLCQANPFPSAGCLPAPRGSGCCVCPSGLQGVCHGRGYGAFISMGGVSLNEEGSLGWVEVGNLWHREGSPLPRSRPCGWKAFLLVGRSICVL